MLIPLAAMLLQSALTVPGRANVEQDAHRAQSRFEAIRRINMPRMRASGPPDPCPITIGRLCYWHDSADVYRIPDPRPIVAARTRLIATLDSLATLDPRNGWIAGQRVRYLIEAERWSDALGAARACAAERWWCSALRGLSLHVAQQYADADSAFATALAAMPASDRCAWTDVRALMWPRAARELAHLGCAQRAAYANGLWALAQPTWMTRGNDARTEHFARQTMVHIGADAAEPQHLGFTDLRAAMIRYGWPEWYSRDDNAYASALAEPSVSSHDREPSFAVYPDLASVRDGRVLPGDWHLTADVAPARYAPRHVSAMLELPHQLARFPRGDSMLVVVAFARTDTVLAADSITTAFGALVGGVPRMHVASDVRVSADRVAGVLRQMVANDETVVSAEIYGWRSRRLARARYTIDRLQSGSVGALSDLLLYDPTNLPDHPALDVAISAALIEPRLSPRQALGIAWQLRPPPGASAVVTDVRIEPIRVSTLRRMAIRMGIVGEPDAVRVRWQSAADTNVHTVSLHLPTSAQGSYRITLSLENAAGALASSSREVELVPER